MIKRIAFVNFSMTNSIARGAGYVVGALIGNGYSVDYFQTTSKWGVIRLREIAEKIVAGKYDFLFMSAFTMFFPDVVRLAGYVKAHSSVPTVLGGIHAILEGPAILKQCPEIDYVCSGEGETFALELIRGVQTGSLGEVPNLCYRSGSQIIQNPCGSPESLETLPAYPWHLFSKEQILDSSGFLTVHATRGCPFRCTYCCNHAYLNLYHKDYIRFRPIESVLQEIAMLKSQYAPELFFFGDEMLLSDREYFRRLTAAMKSTINMPYGCMARVEYLSPEIIQVMGNTGCKYVGIGVECGDETFRKEFLNRHMTNEQIIKTGKGLKEAGISTTTFNMIGYPVDYDEALTQKTVELNETLAPNYAQFTIFFPFPGTKLFRMCVQNELIDWRKYRTCRSYYDESVLKGKRVKKTRDALHRKFNHPPELPRREVNIERGKKLIRDTVGRLLLRIFDI